MQCNLNSAALINEIKSMLLWNAINAFIHYFSLKKNDFSLKRNSE